MDEGPPPPPPPPHGQHPRPPGGGLPDGNYDIFIIPPHSAGGGFLYLPSLQPHRNSFIAGILVTLAAIGIWIAVAPVLQAWMATVMAGNALGVMILVGVVGLGAWALGKTSGETSTGPGSGGSGGAPGAGQQRYKSAGPQPNGYAPPPGTGGHAPPPPQHEHRQQAPPHPPPPQEEYRSPPPPPPGREEPAPPPPPPPPEPQQPPPKPSAAQSGWEKAREETKRKEEERKRAEDLQKKREAAQKMREEAERAAKAKAEKEKWEQARAREKEQREREARERIAKEKLAKEKEAREKDQREREAREKEEKAKADREAAARDRVEKLRLARENIRIASAATAKTSPAAPASAAAASAPSPTKKYERPTAKSAVGTEDAHSYRPYDTHSSPAKSRMNYKASSASSISGLSESSYAPSMSTARTTPPPSRRGPYKTDDPNKIVLRAVYEFNDSFPGKPVSQLVSNEGSVTDGLVLRIATEGLFIDDDVRGVPQREWDMKAWQLKSVDDGALKGAGSGGGALHVLRATLRDGVSRKHVFVLEEGEAHKVALGLQRLKAGPLVRSLKVNTFKESEVKGILTGLGWI